MRKSFIPYWLTLSFVIICCFFTTSYSKTETKDVEFHYSWLAGNLIYKVDGGDIIKRLDIENYLETNIRTGKISLKGDMLKAEITIRKTNDFPYADLVMKVTPSAKTGLGYDGTYEGSYTGDSEDILNLDNPEELEKLFRAEVGTIANLKFSCPLPCDKDRYDNIAYLSPNVLLVAFIGPEDATDAIFFDDDFSSDTSENAETEENYLLDSPLGMFIQAISEVAFAGVMPDMEETEPEKKEDRKPLTYQDLDKKPVFMGSDVTTFSNWVKSNVVYPDYAIENNIQGSVMVQFIVERDGSISNVEIVNDADRSLGDEVKRVVESSPKWTPASHQDKTVRVVFRFPVEFRLE